MPDSDGKLPSIFMTIKLEVLGWSLSINSYTGHTFFSPTRISAKPNLANFLGLGIRTAIFS